MGKVRDAFLTLLRSGLWNDTPQTEGKFPLCDEEWKEVLALAMRQSVAGVVFDGICRLPEGLQPAQATFARWVAVAARIEKENEKMNIALKDLVKLFSDNGLTPVLQKGQGVAELYPVPSHRQCGDIDLYFPEGGNATGLVKAQGTKVESMPDGSQSYEWEGVEIEHHPTIVDLSGPFMRKWSRTLDEEPGTVPSPLADGLRVPSLELNAILLNTHVLKHALGKGVGLRQICDLAVVYHRMSQNGEDKERGERIYSLYRQAWILKWSRLLHSFIVNILGLPMDELPYPERMVSPEPLLRIVEDGGNFGQHRPVGQRAGRHGNKLHTAGMFVRRAGFSLRFAPNEAFWTVVNLTRGQFKSSGRR